MHLRNLLEKKAHGNASWVTTELLKKLKVPVTTATIVDTIEGHPDYPSLYSISDSLQKWRVENLALKLDAEKLEEIPTPFIAHSKSGGGNFLLVNSVNGVVNYIDEKGRQREKSKEEFHKDWDNIVLLAEKQEQSGEKNYKASRKKEAVDTVRMPLIISASLLLIALFYASTANVLASALLLLKFAGAITTGLLLWFEIDKSNPVVQQICSGGKKTNCIAVLGSKQSKLLNWVSWSEIGFFYFVGSFLFSLLTPNNQSGSLSILSWLNVCALPYTVFSIFYPMAYCKTMVPVMSYRTGDFSFRVYCLLLWFLAAFYCAKFFKE